MIIGDPSKLSIFSQNNRNFQVKSFQKSIVLQPNKSNYYIESPFQLSQGYTIAIHAYYTSTNNEPKYIIKLVEWSYNWINIQVTNIESDMDNISLNICILCSDSNSLKIDNKEEEFYLDLFGYVLTKENLNTIKEPLIDDSSKGKFFLKLRKIIYILK